MALVDSLLTAMVRADGDALVMHVGEKPYVVAQARTIDLSTHPLNLSAMTGMLAQLLPADSQAALDEFGAVEQSLPPSGDDRFTIVAARGGGDIWIEIRRRREGAAAVAEEADAPVVSSGDAGASSDEPVGDEIAAPEIIVVDEGLRMDDERLGGTPLAMENQPMAMDDENAATESDVEETFVLDAAELPEALRQDQAVVASDRAHATADQAVPLQATAAVKAVTAPELASISGTGGGAPPPAATSPSSVGAGDPAALPFTRTVRIEVPSRTPSSTSSPSSPVSRIELLLRAAATRGASDLFLSAQARPSVRVDGDIKPLDGESPMSAADVEAIVLDLVPEVLREAVRRGDTTEWSIELPEIGRVACASFRDQRGPGALFRLASTRAASADQLGFGPELQSLATEPDGLVLVTGPHGSGKSTILSAFVDTLNRRRGDYIITLEREPRLLHDNRHAFVSQRQMSGDAASCAAAARAALRENPDVLVVDSVDSAELAELVLDAAGQGRLVFASVDASSTSVAMDRLVTFLPEPSRATARTGLAASFRGAIAQVLVRKAGGGRLAARELLLGTGHVASVIAKGALGDLPAAIDAGRRFGMTSLTGTLVGHVQSGAVDLREAFRKAPDRAAFLSGLKVAGVDTALLDRLEDRG